MNLNILTSSLAVHFIFIFSAVLAISIHHGVGVLVLVATVVRCLLTILLYTSQYFQKSAFMLDWVLDAKRVGDYLLLFIYGIGICYIMTKSITIKRRNSELEAVLADLNS